MVEICCGSYEDALNAFNGGAKRIELNSALYLGGLTPSLGSLLLTKKNTDLQVICMVRPRGAGFCYTEIEFEQIMSDAELLLQNGADGLAFGFLFENNEIDTGRTLKMANLIKKYEKEAVFHRAFDCVPDPKKSMEVLVSLKVDRVLTSGLQATAMAGKTCLKLLEKEFGTEIEILAGSGVNAGNAKELMEFAKVTQVHSSCKAWKLDPTTSGEVVSYSYATGEHKDDFDYVSEILVAALVEAT
jgi:copper homeostasis protein